jgi:hypothetical protein
MSMSLDHLAESTAYMQVYIDCLERIRDTRMRHKCRELSGDFLQ